MEKYKFESKSEEKIVENACEEFGLKESEVVYKITEEKGGLLKSKKYIIELIKLSDLAEAGKEILKDILKGFNINANIEVKLRDKQIKYDVYSDNNSILIGKRGHILESLQTYLKQALYCLSDIFVLVSIDIENYKEKQNNIITRKAKKIAREVALSKIDVKLDPMNSYERKLVHDAVSGFKYIISESVGEEPNRCVIIKYKGNSK